MKFHSGFNKTLTYKNLFEYNFLQVQVPSIIGHLILIISTVGPRNSMGPIYSDVFVKKSPAPRTYSTENVGLGLTANFVSAK